MYKLQNASEINKAIGQIPMALENDVWITKKGELPVMKDSKIRGGGEKFKAIVVNDKIVTIASENYKLIQHEQAFRPVIEGLTLRGVENFKFSLFYTNKKAWMNIFVGKGFDGVAFGFRVTNSVDRSTSVRYGLSAFTKTRILELVGYRQVCSNGMVIRVNLDDAEFVKMEERIKIDELLKKNMAFRHMGDVKGKLEEIQYVVEAFTLLKNPLERIIKKAQKIKLTNEVAEEFIKKYVGQRKLDKVMEQYGHEEQTLWGLYNSITYLTSHTVLDKARRFDEQTMKAGRMLEAEIKVKV